MALQSLNDLLVSSKGRPTGFDYLRIGLSVAVIAAHTVVTLYGLQADHGMWSGWARLVLYWVLPGFFALSGFLVAGSLERNDLPSFVTLRVLRLIPALGVEVLLSAMLLGTWLTALPLSEYYRDPGFSRYLLNAIGDIHYYLPGVFAQNPLPGMVNVQLWTVPHELECYLAISLLAVLTAHKRPRLFFGFLVVALVGMAMRTLWNPHPDFIYRAAPGHILVLSFLFGVAFYLLRWSIPASTLLALASGASVAALAWHEALTFLVPLPATYFTVFLGLQNPRKVFFLRGADYSYGMYLYGFPIQQTLVAVVAFVWPWWLHLAASLTLASLFAFVSWHLVEKQALVLKGPALKVSRRFAQVLPSWLAVRPNSVREVRSPREAGSATAAE